MQKFLQNVSIFFSSSRFDLLRFNTTNNNNNMGRRKNPHPQRAVNARTVLKVVKGRKQRKKKKREKNLWCCVRGFLTRRMDLEANHHQIQKEEEEEGSRRREEEERTVRRRSEEKERGTSAMCAGRCFDRPSDLARHIAYSHERETVRM